MLRRSIFWFGLPLLALGFSWNMVAFFFLKYATDVLRIAPGAVGLAFGLSRVWDAVSDPLAGYWSDRTRSRWGRRRPWMLLSAVPLGLAGLALWAPPRALEGPALFAWVVASLLVYYTAMTAFRIPHGALGAELSEDPHERTRAFTSAHLFELLGGLLGLAALGVLLEAGVDQRVGLFWLGLVTAVAAVLLCLLATLRLREPPEHRDRGPRSPLAAARHFAANPHARRLLAVGFLQTTGLACLATSVPFAAEYLLGDLAYMPLLLGTFVVASLVSTPLWAPLSRRFGRRETWLAAQAVEVAALAGLFFASGVGFVPSLLLTGLLGVAESSGPVLGASLRADVIDWDERQTGERKEGAYWAGWNLAWKLGTGVSAFVVGVALDLGGFASGAAQSEGALLTMRVLLGVVPCALFAAGLVLLLGYRLEEDRNGPSWQPRYGKTMLRVPGPTSTSRVITRPSGMRARKL